MHFLIFLLFFVGLADAVEKDGRTAIETLKCGQRLKMYLTGDYLFFEKDLEDGDKVIMSGQAKPDYKTMSFNIGPRLKWSSHGTHWRIRHSENHTSFDSPYNGTWQVDYDYWNVNPLNSPNNGHYEFTAELVNKTQFKIYYEDKYILTYKKYKYLSDVFNWVMIDGDTDVEWIELKCVNPPTTTTALSSSFGQCSDLSTEIVVSDVIKSVGNFKNVTLFAPEDVIPINLNASGNIYILSHGPPNVTFIGTLHDCPFINSSSFLWTTRDLGLAAYRLDYHVREPEDVSDDNCTITFTREDGAYKPKVFRLKLKPELRSFFAGDPPSHCPFQMEKEKEFMLQEVIIAAFQLWRRVDRNSESLKLPANSTSSIFFRVRARKNFNIELAGNGTVAFPNIEYSPQLKVDPHGFGTILLTFDGTPGKGLVRVVVKGNNDQIVDVVENIVIVE